MRFKQTQRTETLTAAKERDQENEDANPIVRAQLDQFYIAQREVRDKLLNGTGLDPDLRLLKLWIAGRDLG